VAFNVATLIFLGHLTWFHIKLQKMEITTYEYIRMKENKTEPSKIKKRVRTVKKEDNLKDRKKLLV
jgi:hypothetical protein